MLREFPTTHEEFILWKLERSSHDSFDWYTKRTQWSTRGFTIFFRKELQEWIDYVCEHFPEYITATPKLVTDEIVLKVEIVSVYVYSLYHHDNMALYNKLINNHYKGPLIE